jgi:hypothetical protein
MATSSKDMTTEEKLDWLWHEHQSTRQVIAGISARLDEVGGVIVELEKQLKGLQAGTAQRGRPRPILKLDREN